MIQWILTVLSVAVLFGSSAVLSANPDEMGEYSEGDIVSVAPSLLQGQTRAGVTDKRYRWPNAVVIFQFSASYTDPRLRQMVHAAMKHIESYTCIRFKERTTEKDYINIITGNGCYSHVGRIGGAQDISLPLSCCKLGINVHEIMHALGFNHEQSRPDRDDWVKINYDKIKKGAEVNFAKLSPNWVSYFGVNYDYGSLMHYSPNAFSIDGVSSTIVPKAGRGTQIGQRVRMSELDIVKVNNMYNCPNSRSGGESAERTLKLFRRK